MNKESNLGKHRVLYFSGWEGTRDMEMLERVYKFADAEGWLVLAKASEPAGYGFSFVTPHSLKRKRTRG